MLSEIITYFQSRLTIPIYFDMVPETTNPPFTVLEVNEVIPKYTSGTSYFEEATITLHTYAPSMADLETYVGMIQSAFDLEQFHSDCISSLRTKTQYHSVSGNVYLSMNEYRLQWKRNK